METVWSPELIERLGALWRAGLSTAEIGRQLGVTKNAVVGKAHRLLLKPRPSPLKRPPAPKVVPIAAPSCAWPLGHPGEKGFHFCGDRPLPGKPYCGAHAALAYVRPKNASNAA
ncbi:MAG TPA: GcrA family cell cycle regulator [Stellaceae bacterium]|nr:GcrA family cell cycle regulator [Stellaceae bacterium]